MTVNDDEFELVRDALCKRIDDLIAAAAGGDMDEIELERQCCLAALLTAVTAAFDLGVSKALIDSTGKGRLH